MSKSAETFEFTAFFLNIVFTILFFIVFWMIDLLNVIVRKLAILILTGFSVFTHYFRIIILS